MELLLTPILFLAGAACGGVLVRRWQVRHPQGGDGRRSMESVSWQKAKLVWASAVVTTLALEVVGYAVARRMLKPTRVSPATVKQAVSDFRRTRSRRASPTARIPAAGVYRYAAAGFYEMKAPVVGTDRRKMPLTVPGVLVADGECWELTLRYFSQHHWTARYCRGASGALRSAWTRSTNEFFSVKSRVETRCRPNLLWRPGGLVGPGPGHRPGTVWRERCRSRSRQPQHDAKPVETVNRYLGRDAIRIGRRVVESEHLRSSFTMQGVASGTFHQDFWYSRDSGLLLQLTTKGRASGLGSYIAA